MTGIFQKIRDYPGLVLRKIHGRANKRKLQAITDAVPKPAAGGIKILFGPSFAIYHTLKLHDILLSSILAAKGARITYLSNSFGLQACNVCGGITQIANQEIKKCVYCSRFARNDADLVSYFQKFADIFRIEQTLSPMEISDIKKAADDIPETDLENFEYEHVPIGKYSIDIVRNQGYVADVKLVPDYLKRVRNTIFSNLLYYHYFRKAIEKETPDIILTHDVFYAPWALLRDLAVKNNIPYYNYYPGLRHNTFHYVKNQTAMLLEIDELFEKWRNRTIRADKLRKLQKIFDNRRQGKIYAGTESWIDNSEESKKFQAFRASKKPIAVLYGNVLWDLAALNREAVFPSIQETFLETVKFFLDKPEYQLVIKPHPAELRFGHESKEKLTDLISKAFPKLPENILLLNPKTSLTAYDLIPKSNLTLSYTTTVGIESVILGTPTVTLGASNYRGKGFTFDPADRNAYFALLKNTLDTRPAVDKQAKNLAEKYYYLYFFVYFYDYNIISFDLYEKTKLIPRTLQELLNNPDFSKLAEAILNRQDIPYFDGGL